MSDVGSDCFGFAPESEDTDSKLEENALSLAPVSDVTSNFPEKKNIIKIFLCSAGTDMKLERNVLTSSVFSKLKEYCQVNYKLEFEVVDLKDVQDQASDDNSTSELSMKEILNCQKESAGPNFVCLLGDKYGTRYLKKSITEKDWTILVSRVRSSEVKQLLDVWYKLDTSSATPQRNLQPISSVENGPEQWDQSSALMYSALKNAAIQAKNDGELAPEAAQVYVRSVMEEEIDCAGMLSDGEYEKQSMKCLAFIRRINGIELKSDEAEMFIDITDDHQVDDEMQGLLDRLRQQVKFQIPESCIREYQIDWTDDGGVNIEQHQEYLQTFCDDFYEQVKTLIDASMETKVPEPSAAINALDNEVSALSTEPKDPEVETVTNETVPDDTTSSGALNPHPPSAPRPDKQKKVNAKVSNALNSDEWQDVLQDIRTYEQGTSKVEEETLPANLKLYSDLPAEERDKRLEQAFSHINSQGYTATCGIM